ncbi:hypothetical protein [Microbacterium elymi]|uniref:Uncharacterized protein n=1 Tax=Microbacterium elymi TaxID=2909587 RepID=A0ABY5NGL4_9MICO|nr:hypothetical protein [Microbacterium elymi]UUT34310.1 hypothetical protein L2X98_26990 [Microbacterium elymi]
MHALMVGVTIGPAGPVFENAADGAPWLVPLTWVAQIMPLFFVIGGYAGSAAYRRLRAQGGTSVGFVTARVHRLLAGRAVDRRRRHRTRAARDLRCTG